MLVHLVVFENNQNFIKKFNNEITIQTNFGDLFV